MAKKKKKQNKKGEVFSVSRVGDYDDDPDQMIQGSPTVFAGDKGFSSGISRTTVVDGHLVRYTAKDVAAIEDDSDSSTVAAPGYEPGDPNAKPEPTPSQKDDKTPPEHNVLTPGCEDITDQTTSGYQLSPNFSVAQLSTKCAASSYEVRAQQGLTRAKIICNLKALAINCLGPLKAQYGSGLIITSGFRSKGGTSQHEKGQAADIQWADLNSRHDFAEYFARAQWVRDNIAFDQFLYEYNSGSGNPWLHISFNPQGNRPRNNPTAVMTQRLSGGFESGLIRRR